MANLFDLLGYNFQTNDPRAIVQFSNTAVQMLETLPPFLDDWQYDALKNQDTSGYLQNPVAGQAGSILSTANEIVSISTDINGLESVLSTAESLANQAQEFFDHTQRISGLAEITPETAELPHYDMAIAIGKAITYLVYQADGKTDNETIMGNFTSILVGNELSTNFSTISGYTSLISGSIVCEFVPTDPENPEGGGEEVCSTTLSPSQISEINSGLNSVGAFLQTRRSHDENFYTNSRDLLESFNQQQRYKDFGATERNLFENYLGTPKLLNNINQN